MSSPDAPGGPIFTAPHAAPPAGALLTAPPVVRRRRPMGAVALTLSILAGVVASGVAGLAAFGIARGAGTEFVARGGQAVDWRLLSPVRDLVLVAEIALWSGTVLGVAALTLGIVATVRNSGRASGIAAIVISALGPFLFAGLVLLAVAAGAGATTGSGTPI